MNILPHKSWHVRNKRNIDRVRRDEQKAEDEEKEINRRKLLAQQEYRTEVLRKRARDNQVSRVTTTVVPGSSLSESHVNIFEGIDDKGEAKNKDHEREVRDEKEKWEKTMGIVTYLGQSQLDDGERPWYLQSHDVRMKLRNDSDTNDQKLTVENNKDIKRLNDPLEHMKRYLEVMRKKNGDMSRNATVKREVKGNDAKKKDKKHNKKKSKKRETFSSGESSDDEESNVKNRKKSIEQLRAERLKRENIERERTRLLLNREKTKTDDFVADERQRAYNSQFNPHIAKQNISNS